jgi:hypothetical protein
MEWSSGDTVVLQEVWQDRVWAARPMTVVRDDGDSIVLWFPRGTTWKRPVVPASRRVDGSRAVRLASCLELGDWAFEDAEWDVSTLWLMRAGEWHAQWVSWLEDGTHWGWYVNLQEPFRRTAKGFESMDLVRDVLIDPDWSWRWKDEDELAVFVDRGVFDEELETRVREEGLRVVRRAQRGEAPFDEPWPDWRPDPGWATPILPEDWGVRWR